MHTENRFSKVDSVIDDINPIKSKRSKLIKFAVLLLSILIPEFAWLSVGIRFWNNELYWTIPFWGSIIISLSVIIYCGSRIYDIFFENPIKVSHKHTGKDLEDFAILYDKLFPEMPSKTPADQIIKWVQDTYDLLKERKNKPVKNDILDFLLLAKIDSQICGFFKITYYFNSGRFAFISFLGVVDKKDVTVNDFIRPKLNNIKRAFSQYLQLRINRFFINCKGYVAECEDKIKIRDFRTFIQTMGKKYRLRNLSETPCLIPYKQPDPNEKDPKEENEIPMDLLYVRLKDNPAFGTSFPVQNEIEDILTFCYLKSYYDSFPDDNEINAIYQPYLRKLYDRVWNGYLEKNKK